MFQFHLIQDYIQFFPTGKLHSLKTKYVKVMADFSFIQWGFLSACVPWTCIITGHGNDSEFCLSFVFPLSPQSDHFL